MSASVREAFVREHRRIGIDTNVLIALIERQADYYPAARSMFAAIQRFQPEVFLSVITIPEVLTQPLRLKHPKLATEYARLLLEGPFSFADITLPAAQRAASLGARYRLRTLDGLILSSLLEQEVTGFVTADRVFARVKELDVHVLGPSRRH